MRTDRDRRLTAREPAARGSVLLCGKRAREQDDRDDQLGADRIESEKVLLCEGFRRRHQCALAPALHRAQERVERHGGLAGADVPLEQALHRHPAGEVRVDLRDRALLMLGQREREHGAVALDQLARLAERRRDRRLALAGALREADLEHEQLVEREPAAAFLRLGERARPVEHVERVVPEGQPLLRLQRRRKRIGQCGCERERRLDKLTQLLRRDLLARRIDRGEVRRRERLLAEVIALDRRTRSGSSGRAGGHGCRVGAAPRASPG